MLKQLFALTASCVVLFADSKIKKGENIQINFVTLSIGSTTSNLVYIQDNLNKNFYLDNNSFSVEQNYIGPRQIKFYKIKTNVELENNPSIILANKKISSLNNALKAEAEADKAIFSYKNYQEYISSDEKKTTAYEQMKLENLKIEAEKLQKKASELKNEYYLASELSAKENNPEPKPKDDIKNSTAKTPPPELIDFAEVNITESGKYILFFYEINNKNKILPLKDDDNNFPFGSLFFFNNTKNFYEIRTKSQNLKLSPGQRGIMQTHILGNEIIDTKIFQKMEDEYIPLKNVSRCFDQNTRVLFLLSEDDQNFLEVKSIESYKQINADKLVESNSQKNKEETKSKKN
jgi:hypothetical protein